MGTWGRANVNQVESTRIEQVLHGYSDGHRLLASSTELSRVSRHAMLALSDMSGRSIVRDLKNT